jgi:hypothetical protein
MAGLVVLLALSAMAQLPTSSPRAIPTPFGTPDANGHINVNLPVTPPKGSPYERNPGFYARERAMCQMVADKQYAREAVDHEQALECGRLRYEIWVYSKPRPNSVGDSPGNNLRAITDGSTDPARSAPS